MEKTQYKLETNGLCFRVGTLYFGDDWWRYNSFDNRKDAETEYWRCVNMQEEIIRKVIGDGNGWREIFDINKPIDTNKPILSQNLNLKMR